MATNRLRTIVTHLRALGAHFGPDTADRELLRQFVERRDEAAFAEVVRRHGQMLLRVCRRTLHSTHDAEDVCQAAFLLLARKATSVRWHESVAGWLFQAAYRLSLKARGAAVRRRHHEARASSAAAPDPIAELSVRELQAVLDEELYRLPEKYRAPILLCCVEGKSRDEAARQLGWEPAAVKDRLERGRERLRVRLARRGVLLGTALTSAWLLEGGIRAAWSDATVNAALALATGQATLASLLPARIATLAEGVTKTMSLSRITILALVGVALGLGAVGLVTGFLGGPPPAQAQAAAPTPPKPVPTETTLIQPAALLLGGHQGPVRAVAFGPAGAPDDKKFVTAAADGTIRFWNLATGRERSRLGHEHGDIVGVAFSPDGQGVVASDARDGWLIAFELRTGNPDLLSEGPKGGGGGAVAFSPDGKRVATGFGPGKAAVFDVATRENLLGFTGDTGAMTAAAFSAAGKAVAFGDGWSVWVRDAEQGRPLNSWENKQGGPARAFLLGGCKVAVADRGKPLRIVDGLTGKEEATLAGAEDVRAVSLSSDGKQAATVGSGGEVRLWDVPTGKELRRFAATGEVHALAWSPDGKRLATVDEDGTAVVWDLTRDEKPLPKDLKLTDRDLLSLWDDLAGDDGIKAYAAQRTLRADPERSVPFLRERLRPREPGADEQKVRQLIADLDADEFEKRENASQELEKLGRSAEPALRAALTAGPSPEARRRLERLVTPAGDERLTPERHRDVRAVRVLELAGTPEARALLEALAKESPGGWLAQEARAALERLDRRDRKP